MVDFGSTSFRVAGTAYRSRMYERSSIDTPCHGGVSPIFVTGTLCPLPDSVVVTRVILILLHRFNGSAKFVYLKKRDNFGSTLLAARSGWPFTRFGAWFGPQNPLVLGSVGLHGLLTYGFTRTYLNLANNVTPLLIIHNSVPSKHTTDEHVDKIRDHMGHP